MSFLLILNPIIIVLINVKVHLLFNLKHWQLNISLQDRSEFTTPQINRFLLLLLENTKKVHRLFLLRLLPLSPSIVIVIIIVYIVVLVPVVLIITLKYLLLWSFLISSIFVIIVVKIIVASSIVLSIITPRNWRVIPIILQWINPMLPIILNNLIFLNFGFYVKYQLRIVYGCCW